MNIQDQIKVLEAKAAEMQKEIEVLKTMQQSEQGMTWERALNAIDPIYYPNFHGNLCKSIGTVASSAHLNVPTEADAKSLIAHAKLSVIAAACNQGKEVGNERYGVELIKGKLDICAYENYVALIEFYSESDRDQSMITNRQLWLDFYKK